MFYFSGYIYYFDDEATAYKKLDVSDDSISAGWGDIDTSFTYYFATLNNVYALDSNSKYIIIK